MPPYFALLSYNAYGKTSERELAIAEGKALLDAMELDERIMGVPTQASIRQAAFVSTLSETIAAAPTLEELCAQVRFRQVAASGFKIVVRKIPLSLPRPSPELQEAVARAIRGKPNLDHPTEVFLLVVTARGFWLGKILERSEERWRLHRVRPMPYIRSLPVRVARAILNLVAKPGQRIVDPCCGAGTFLVEAADMGIHAEGYDINPKMVSGSNNNLQHFGFAPCARVADARALMGRWDAVVTDLPYGHISNYEDSKDAPDILRNILNLAPHLAVVTARPEEPVLAEAQTVARETITLPVSRSLTRYIHLLQVPENHR
jgi:tRNA G10  N-methylase Trm11